MVSCFGNDPNKSFRLVIPALPVNTVGLFKTLVNVLVPLDKNCDTVPGLRTPAASSWDPSNPNFPTPIELLT